MNADIYHHLPAIPAPRWVVWVAGGVVYAGVNWAALGSWIGQQDWRAISTTIGLAIFNIAVGVTAAVNYWHNNRAKARREQEELDKDSWSARLARTTRELDEARADISDRDREIADLKADVERMHADAQALRESSHKQRGELNRQVLEQVNESNELRVRLRELSREVEALKAGGNNQPKGVS